MQLLLMSRREEDFLQLGELLARVVDVESSVDRATSAEEALIFMSEKAYDVLLCESRPGSELASQLLKELHLDGPGSPLILLTDDVDQAALAGPGCAAAYECMQLSRVDEDSLIRTLRHAMELYQKDRQREKAEDVVRKLWRAVEQSADLVIITDRSGVIEYVNPAFEALTGFAKEEAIGRTPRILRSGQHAPAFYRQMWRGILGGTVFRGVLVNRKKNGQIFYAEKTITPLRAAGGEITHFISNDRDITGRRTLELQLQQSQRMDAIGRLASGVAHDFNNLLMVISANAELMMEALSPRDAQHPRVQEILAASRRAAGLTRQLLAFGRHQVQPQQPVDLNRILDEISHMLPRLLGEDIELAIVPAKDLAQIKADPVQIEQVVMNLAANARDAMPRGGRLIVETMNVHLDREYARRHSFIRAGDYVLLAVTDSGQGVAPEHMAHIFEPFYTTKEEGKGTGLGLATVYGIVKQNGGFVWVYSEPGMGTTFKIYWPRAQRVGGRRRVDMRAEEKCPRGAETLLLVEDEEAVRRTAHEFLSRNGYAVLDAENGEAALLVAQRHEGEIHLMISDVVMPHMGGARLAEQLVALRPNMKVLFVSGYAENTVALQTGVDVGNHFLQKPFGLKALACKVREVLESRAATAAAAAGSSR